MGKTENQRRKLLSFLGLGLITTVGISILSLLGRNESKANQKSQPFAQTLTWRAYQNRYWPHLFLANRQGEFVYHHIGEGAYAETEQMIKTLLI